MSAIIDVGKTAYETANKAKLIKAAKAKVSTLENQLKALSRQYEDVNRKLENILEQQTVLGCLDFLKER